MKFYVTKISQEYFNTTREFRTYMSIDDEEEIENYIKSIIPDTDRCALFNYEVFEDLDKAYTYAGYIYHTVYRTSIPYLFYGFSEISVEINDEMYVLGIKEIDSIEEMRAELNRLIKEVIE